MKSLLPIVGFENELKKGYKTSDTCHYPVTEDKKRPFNQTVVLSLHTTHDIRIHIKEISKDEGKKAHI